MDAGLPHASATFEPIVSYDVDVDFDSFVHMALSEVTTSFDLVDEPDGDVAPFAVIAEGRDMYLVQWHDIDPGLAERFVTHVVPPTLAARNAHIAGLFLTTHLTPPGGERIEAALLSVLETDGARARECSLAAEIRRSLDRGPRLDSWELIDERVAPAIARSLYSGMLGSLTDEAG
jgi:hypothetical protein